MLDDFLIRAALAGVGLSIAVGPLGSFVVWRRMAYFGDATAHAAILGVALALIFSAPVTLGTLVVAAAMALAVSWLSTRGHAMDATLGVLSHSALALGLVAISFVPGVRVDLSAFLFGDILAVTWADLAVIWGGAGLVAALIAWRWSRLLTATLSRDLAAASGINADREGLILTLSLAVVVAVALKVVGALLIAAMLIIPAAAARGPARAPETMAVLAALIGAFASLAGLAASYQFDTPAGPSIVVAASAIYLVSALFSRLLPS
ncbi:metal ABC transporter permease [Aliiroseovarius subalbicans]|uniref:metal ABC transporter permease n=1 Tax=Aliiroseovarius subalbicans TaxID=2925840 RepID=UPI001F57E173|nr:metal ABC transporter permease [Aliiroseovarius subalbicans]MCI2397818.1 metal ABC transporter permease [Aliiroseovarius subalbicans]